MRKHRIKAFRQLESADCGLTCIRIIAHYYGKEISIRQLRTMTETNRLGTSLNDLKGAFKAIGMESIALRIRETDISSIPMPAVIFWRQSHFVVLYGIDLKKGIYLIADPDEGKRKIPEREFMELWKGDNSEGIVLLAEPSDSFKPSPADEPSSLHRLWEYVRTEIKSRKNTFLLVILLSLICMGADLLLPLMLQSTVDEGIARHDISLVWLLIAGQLAIFIGGSVSSNAISLLMTRIGLKMNLEMTAGYLRRLLSFPLSFFDSKIPSDLIQKINDQSRIKDFVIQIPSSSLLIALNLLVFAGLLIYYNAMLFFIFILISLLEVIWTLLFMGRRRNLDYSYITKISENRNNEYELIYGITEIKAAGATERRFREWENTQKDLLRIGLKSRTWGLNRRPANRR